MGYQACRQRKNKEGSTPFTNWIREQKGLESGVKVGYVGTDVDLVWYNYRIAMIMLLEEKQHMGVVSESQEATEHVLHQALSFAFNHPDFILRSLRKPVPSRITYCGYHLIQFENTGPNDGAVHIDNAQVTKDELVRFLQFKWVPVIQCCLDQQSWIHEARSLNELERAAEKIRNSGIENHPERSLLLACWHQKKQELARWNDAFITELA